MCGLAACMTACGPDEPPIPPPVPPPPPPPPVVNDLGFEPHEEGQPFDTYKGLVMTGYQGWFGAPGDGSQWATPMSKNTSWYHYRENEGFKPGVLQNSIDFWPDMSEYTKQYTPGGVDDGGRSEAFILPNGEKATVFSSYDESTVMLHFKWMKDYSIDGAFMQRFVGEVVNNSDGKEHFNKVLDHAMKASNQHQRAICVMYDLGGYEPRSRNNTAAVLADTQEILDKYNLKDRNQQKFYLHHNGKPLIVLWGVGFNDNRPYTLDDIEELMNGLKEKGFSIMLGVPTHWRLRGDDTVKEAKLHELIKAADVIMPWFVGRFGENNYSPTFANIVKDDVKWCETNGVDYAPLCYPGSSDRNMHPNNGVNPRNGGSFFWKQVYNCVDVGAKMLYIAMFDEIDEGTAIFKCLNQSDVPSNVASEDYWVSHYENGGYRKTTTEQTGPYNGSALRWSRKASEMDITFIGIEDNLKTDHYLWLTGQARAMLRGDIPMTSTQPTRN